MKKLSILVLPFLLAACFSKQAATPPTPELATVSSEIIITKEPEVEKPTTTSTKTPEKVTPPKKTTPEPTKTTNSEENADAMTAELDRLIDEIVGA